MKLEKSSAATPRKYTPGGNAGNWIKNGHTTHRKGRWVFQKLLVFIYECISWASVYIPLFNRRNPPNK